MSRGFSRFFILVLAATAVVCGALGASHHWGERGSNLLFFGSWCAAMLVLLALGLQLPLRIAGSRARAILYNAALAIGAIVVVCLANVAMFRHDVYLDATRQAANTPPPQFGSALDGLSSDVSLTYFYNHSDRNAIDAKDLLTVASRQKSALPFLRHRHRQGAGEGAGIRGSRLQHCGAGGRGPARCCREYRGSRPDGLCDPAGPEKEGRCRLL